MSSEPPSQRLPFEPKKTRKKAAKAKADKAPPPSVTPPTKQPEPVASTRKRSVKDQAIPEEVSQRMLTRMALFAGVPLFLALGVFVASYFIVVNELFILPNTAVLLVSFGCFGLSVVGLSYGLFSASWDEGVKGSLIGLSEFKLNTGRTWEAWRAARQERKESK